ncbi:hypothetical protein [Henriciella sp.]|uniref:hypothetical protein n=1 Tax=Henriciella sp. TaxID=1968823 RepID=UPI0026096D8B|nr:hypothetical protein [Henriciella sp.]
MKRIMTALAATTAFAVTPALADNHEKKSGDTEKAEKMNETATEMHDGDTMKHDASAKMDEQDWTKTSMESEVNALKASQVFLAIDEENDGLITKAEWANWQNVNGDNTKQFADYDADSDGDIELSEYLETYDNS